jgi:hypothetical protein
MFSFSREPVLQVRGSFVVDGEEPQTSKTGLRYNGPISVHHPEFIIHFSAFTLHKSQAFSLSSGLWGYDRGMQLSRS